MLRKAMQVLELFSPTRHEIGVIEVAEELGRPKSTASRWLTAISAAGFLDRDADSGRYRLSSRLAALGELARRSTSLQRVARAELEWLAEQSGETANLVVLLGDVAMNIDVVESRRSLMHVGWVGRRYPCHASAGGKTLLAWRDPEDVRSMLPRRLPRLTSRTITDVDELLRDLARVRDRGYATAWCEMEDDLAAIGAPVRDHTGAVVGAITTSAPVSRAPRRAIPALSVPVIRAADGTSAQLGYRAPAERPSSLSR